MMTPPELREFYGLTVEVYDALRRLHAFVKPRVPTAAVSAMHMREVVVYRDMETYSEWAQNAQNVIDAN